MSCTSVRTRQDLELYKLSHTAFAATSVCAVCIIIAVKIIHIGLMHMIFLMLPSHVALSMYDTFFTYKIFNYKSLQNISNFQKILPIMSGMFIGAISSVIALLANFNITMTVSTIIALIIIRNCVFWYAVSSINNNNEQNIRATFLHKNDTLRFQTLEALSTDESFDEILNFIRNDASMSQCTNIDLSLFVNQFGHNKSWLGAVFKAINQQSNKLQDSIHLDLSNLGNNINNLDFTEMLKAIPRITSLNLNKLNNDTRDVALQALAQAISSGHMEHLTSLNLSDNTIDNFGVEKLLTAISSGHLKRLTSLYINNNKIGDRGAEALAQAISSGHMENLNLLYINNNKIGDRGAEALAQAISSGHMEHLTSLNLSDNKIRDVGVTAVVKAAIAHVATRESDHPLHLEINNNTITDNALEDIVGYIEKNNIKCDLLALYITVAYDSNQDRLKKRQYNIDLLERALSDNTLISIVEYI